MAERLGLLAQVLAELAAVCADEPDPVRANKLRGIARRFAAALEVNRLHGVEFPTAWNRAVARRDRPSARSAIRDKVLAIMVGGHRAAMSLKEFLRHWEQGPIDGVRLTFDSATHVYRVADEDEDAGQTTYKLSVMTKLYSTCKPR